MDNSTSELGNLLNHFILTLISVRKSTAGRADNKRHSIEWERPEDIFGQNQSWKRDKREWVSTLWRCAKGREKRRVGRKWGRKKKRKREGWGCTARPDPTVKGNLSTFLHIKHTRESCTKNRLHYTQGMCAYFSLKKEQCRTITVIMILRKVWLELA